MNETVEKAVEIWLHEFGLPVPKEGEPKDLRGQRVKVCASATDEETVRFFFPKRTVLFHAMMVRAASIHFRKRGAKIDRFPISIEAYARWCEAEGKQDSDRLRYAWATHIAGEAR